MPLYLPIRSSGWYNTEFVDYPEDIWENDPLDPSTCALDAARARVIQTRTEAEAGLFSSSGWTSSSIKSLDLAFLDSADVLLRPPDDDFSSFDSPDLDASLCTICQQIDLDYPTTRHYYAGNSQRQYYWILGSLRNVSRRQSCALCSFIVKLLQISSLNSELAETEWRFAKVELRAYDHTDTGSSRHKYFRAALIFDSPQLEHWSEYTKRDYCISLRSDAIGVFEQRARRLPEVLDLGLIQSWITTCEMEHTMLCCQPMAMATIDPVRLADLRLLDCWSLEVVNASFDWRYVTLSWVWGRFRLSEELSVCLRKRQLTMKHLPPTITDAIHLVQQIGERYLWIDFICIDQFDRQEMNAQLSQMDQVYSSALLTIVAAAGEDAYDGLPGVRPKTRLRGQLDISLGRTQLMTFLPDPFSQPGAVSWGSVIGESKWNSRAWTFQENIFSGRRLIFTPHQTYLFCRKAIYSEDQLDPDSLGAASMGTFQDFDLGREMSGERAYNRVVMQYPTRKVTKDEDMLNACFSLLRPISAQLQTRLCWGLPESIFHNVLAWDYEPYTMSKSPSKASRSALAPTEPALTKTTPSLRARHCFPSWTWASWPGKCRELPLGAFLKPAATFYKQKTDGRLEPLHHSGIDWRPSPPPTQLPIAPYNTGRPPHGTDSGLLVFWAISATFLTHKIKPTRRDAAESGAAESFDSINYVSCSLSRRDGTVITGKNTQPLIVPREWWGSGNHHYHQNHHLQQQQHKNHSPEHLFVQICSSDDQAVVLLIEQHPAQPDSPFFKRITAHWIDHAAWLEADNREWKLIALA